MLENFRNKRNSQRIAKGSFWELWNESARQHEAIGNNGGN